MFDFRVIILYIGISPTPLYQLCASNDPQLISYFRFHKNRQHKGQSNARVMPKRSTTVPLSDYQSTYQHHNTRPRSSKKPPPTPMNPCPPPMTFSTNQRSDFIPKDPRVRPQPIILVSLDTVYMCFSLYYY